MNNLEQLAAKRETCKKMLELGIPPVSFFWWLEDLETTDEDRKAGKIKYEVCPVVEPVPGDECVAAWTKAEIDVMIGPEIGAKPDLFTREQIGNAKTLNPWNYPVFYIDKMRYFFNGAEASADALMYLIEHKKIAVADAVERYSKMFNPLNYQAEQWKTIIEQLKF